MLKRYLLPEQLLFIFLVFLSGCHKEEKMTNTNSTYMNKLTEREWIKISDKKIFFGHQSVGCNILDGIITLKNECNSTSFIVLETKDTSDLRHPLFAHWRIGKNLDPKSKIVDFVNILKSGLGASFDIALMKLCYVDINNRTNINELFEYYQASINSLRMDYPNLKIIHCTVPLTTKSKGVKGLAKIVLGRDDNVYRNKYNKLMRNNYDQNELFDIAKIEAAYSDGTSNIYGYGIPGLIPEYSSDGRHLNQKGSLLVARELISMLLMNL